MILNPFTFYAPKDTGEAAKLLSDLEQCRILAGGTFLINNLKLLKRNGLKTAQNIVSLRKIGELKGISCAKDALTIKSMTTLNDLIYAKIPKGSWQVIQEAAQRIATTPLRNMATIGGNLTCRYTWSEFPAVMIALGAQLHFAGAAAETISAEDFYAQGAKTNKLLTHITVENKANTSAAYKRSAKLSEVDVPLAAVCIHTTRKGKKWTDTRVVINTASTFPKRDRRLEEFLNTTSINQKIPEKSMDQVDVSVLGDRADEHKKHILKACIKSALEEMLGIKTK